MSADLRSRSRGRSRSEATTCIEEDNSVTCIEEDNNVEEIATIVPPEGFRIPQIAPGTRGHRTLGALDEKETRQLLRCQSIRSWWHLRGRLHNAGGVDCRLLRVWMKQGFQPSPTASIDGIPVASQEFNVVVDPVKEKALWDTWGRITWLCIVASEVDWVFDKGYTFGWDDVHFQMDRSLFSLPSSPFIGVVP